MALKPIKYFPFRITSCRRTSNSPIYYLFIHIDKGAEQVCHNLRYCYHSETGIINKSLQRNWFDCVKEELFAEDLETAKKVIIEDFYLIDKEDIRMRRDTGEKDTDDEEAPYEYDYEEYSEIDEEFYNKRKRYR
jgi:hypothetical protein